MRNKTWALNSDKIGFDLIQYKIESLTNNNTAPLMQGNLSHDMMKIYGHESALNSPIVAPKIVESLKPDSIVDTISLTRSISQESVEYPFGEISDRLSGSLPQQSPLSPESLVSSTSFSNSSFLTPDLYFEMFEKFSPNINTKLSNCGRRAISPGEKIEEVQRDKEEKADIFPGDISPIGKPYIQDQTMFTRGNNNKKNMNKWSTSGSQFYKCFTNQSGNKKTVTDKKLKNKISAFIINFENEYDLSIAMKYNIWSIKYKSCEKLKAAYTTASLKGEQLLLLFFNKSSEEFQAIGMMDSCVFLDSDIVSYLTNLAYVNENCTGFRGQSLDSSFEFLDFFSTIMCEENMNTMRDTALKYKRTEKQKFYEKQYIKMCGLANPARLMSGVRKMYWFRVKFSCVKNVPLRIVKNILDEFEIGDFERSDYFGIKNQKWASYICNIIDFFPTQETIQLKLKEHEEREQMQMMALNEKGIF
ncbi:MAG: hypothetical protein MHMPM18_001004 [Marteilia pararefringens]